MHDVVISYSSDDRAILDEIVAITKRMGMTAFWDSEHFDGGPFWDAQFRDAVEQTGPQPALLVICTKSARERPGQIVEELKMALVAGVDVIPIAFDRTASGELLRAAGFDGPERRHYVNGMRSNSKAAMLVDIERQLRVTLSRNIRRKLERERGILGRWQHEMLREVSFWEGTEDGFFDFEATGRPSSVALVARGGAGKTTLLATFVAKSLWVEKDVYPVLVGESSLRDAATWMLSLLGARTQEDLPEHVSDLGLGIASGRPMKIVFVVDGLDRMIVPGDARQSALVSGLTLLARCAPVLVTCRPEVWAEWYAGKVGIVERPVQELPDETVGRLLHHKFPGMRADFTMDLLRVPLFLGIALRLGESWIKVPSNETEFLLKVWDETIADGAPGRDGGAGSRGQAWWIETMAEIQLRDLNYEVPVAVLRASPGYHREFEGGLKRLVSDRWVAWTQGTRPGHGDTVRLRHDLLDNFSMVQVLRGADKKLEAIRDLCARCDGHCGSAVLSTFAQALYDLEETDLLRSLFDEMLALLDRKGQGDSAMARAWAVTHAMQASLAAVLDLILEALGGEQTAFSSRFEVDGSQGSRLGMPGTLTQEAASTLGSAFQAFPRTRLEQDISPRAVDVLARCVRTWKYKGRFIEALGNFKTPESLEAIVRHAGAELRPSGDHRSLDYVAKALQGFDSPVARDVLNRIIDYPGMDAGVRRSAKESLEAPRAHGGKKKISTDEELIAGLAVTEIGSDRYTDWLRVQKSAEEIRYRGNDDPVSPQVLAALVSALGHRHTFARQSVARALGAVRQPSARDALLDLAIEPQLAPRLLADCESALEDHLSLTVDPAYRHGLRFLLIRASRAASVNEGQSAGELLLQLALGEIARTASDRVHTAGAVEVTSTTHLSQDFSTVFCDIEIDAEITAELHALAVIDVGPDREPKFRIGQVTYDVETVRLGLSPATWSSGKRFHSRVKEDPRRFLRRREGWMLPVPLGDVALPGIASVHVILLTSDSLLLCARRPATSAYAPSHWSMSFEEQVTSADLASGGNAFVQAACRGAHEEFGLDVDRGSVSFETLLIEMEILNTAGVVIMTVPDTLEEVRTRWSSEPRPVDAHEAVAIAGLHASPEDLDLIVANADPAFSPMHPTSALRCLVLSRYLRRHALGTTH